MSATQHPPFTNSPHFIADLDVIPTLIEPLTTSIIDGISREIALLKVRLLPGGPVELCIGTRTYGGWNLRPFLEPLYHPSLTIPLGD